MTANSYQKKNQWSMKLRLSFYNTVQNWLTSYKKYYFQRYCIRSRGLRVFKDKTEWKNLSYNLINYFITIKDSPTREAMQYWLWPRLLEESSQNSRCFQRVLRPLNWRRDFSDTRKNFSQSMANNEWKANQTGDNKVLICYCFSIITWRENCILITPYFINCKSFFCGFNGFQK
jgi:hypothetical protein